MSWQIFKDNIVRMSDNPDAISDIDTVAKTYAREYDAAIKRGKDTIEGVSLQKGNVDIMEALFKAALQKGLTSTEPYDLVGEMGKGVLAYWGGAVMNNFPNPKTLPPGAVSNISVTSNIATATTIGAHGLIEGSKVTISGCDPDALNGNKTVKSYYK
jgi:hypothetical protein